MENMARFKMADLETMGVELASRIITLHVSDLWKEEVGGLDDLTVDLFAINVPKFTIKKFSQNGSEDPDDYAGIRNNKSFCNLNVAVEYKKKTNPTTIKIELFHQSSGWKIRYKVDLDGVNTGLLLSRIDANYVATPFLHTNAWSDICLDSDITVGLPPRKIFINFMEALFLDCILAERRDHFIGMPDMTKGLSFYRDDLHDLLVKFQKRLLSGK
jgi:hypothetical protein